MKNPDSLSKEYGSLDLTTNGGINPRSSIGRQTGDIFYEENFEGYAVGDYIGVVSSNFTTWSSTTGGSGRRQ